MVQPIAYVVEPHNYIPAPIYLAQATQQPTPNITATPLQQHTPNITATPLQQHTPIITTVHAMQPNHEATLHHTESSHVVRRDSIGTKAKDSVIDGVCRALRNGVEIYIEN